ncbi:hypothetical protein [Aquipseudomonas alcaligenes]|uniref:hypothetical protein n=1 Tax=Aquipseudomonas alcaligenes TaxID=43263 RepID=UPI0009708D3A|nr:hypothetical protein [Pseudomonas alcaligenes]
MQSTKLTLNDYKLKSLTANQFVSDKNTYEAQFSIKYILPDEGDDFKVDFDLVIQGAGEDTPFFKITMRGFFTDGGKTIGELTDKHTAACMLYPYVREMAAGILRNLGHSDMELPYSVPFSAIAQLDSERIEE